MLAKLNTSLLLLAVGLLLFIAFKPTPALIIQGRFQPITGRRTIALDTKLGQICRTAGLLNPVAQAVNPLDEFLRDKNPFNNLFEETNARLKAQDEARGVLIHCRLLLMKKD